MYQRYVSQLGLPYTITKVMNIIKELLKLLKEVNIENLSMIDHLTQL